MNYSGIPESELIHAFYKNTRAVGNGIFTEECKHGRPVTTKEIADVLRCDGSGVIVVDYIFGRPLKLVRVGLYHQHARYQTGYHTEIIIGCPSIRSWCGCWICWKDNEGAASAVSYINIETSHATIFFVLLSKKHHPSVSSQANMDTQLLLSALHGFASAIDAYHRGPYNTQWRRDPLPKDVVLHFRDQRRLVDLALSVMQKDESIRIEKLQARVYQRATSLYLLAVGVRPDDWITFLRRHGDAFVLTEAKKGCLVSVFAFEGQYWTVLSVDADTMRDILYFCVVFCDPVCLSCNKKKSPCCEITKQSILHISLLKR